MPWCWNWNSEIERRLRQVHATAEISTPIEMGSFGMIVLGEAGSSSLPSCCWLLPVVLLALWLATAARPTWITGLAQQAIGQAQQFARVGDLETAAEVLNAALYHLSMEPPSERAEEDRCLLEAALMTLHHDPRAFARGLVLQMPQPPFMARAVPVADDPLLIAYTLIAQGDDDGARQEMEQALTRLPPTEACKGKDAQLRFELLLQLSNHTRKSTGDVRREYELLNECLPLVCYLPVTPDGPDHLVNKRYLLHMNRGVTAIKLGLLDQATPAFRDALAAARQPDTRCKCLAYLGCNILKEGDRAQLQEVVTVFDQFDQEAQETAIAPTLRVQVLRGRAILCLKKHDIRDARLLLEQAMDIEPWAHLQATLRLLDQPGITSSQVVDFMLHPPVGEHPVPGHRPHSSGTDATRPLPPLSEDL